jgi:hypothetical protein
MALRTPRLVVAAALVLVVACSSSRVTQGPTGAPQPPVVTLSAAGAAPMQLHLFTQEGITFVNQDARVHEIQFDAARSTDPGCAAIAVGKVDAGQQRTSPLLPGFALCYYAAAEAPGDARWQGVVVTH